MTLVIIQWLLMAAILYLGGANIMHDVLVRLGRDGIREMEARHYEDAYILDCIERHKRELPGLVLTWPLTAFELIRDILRVRFRKN